MTTFKVPDGSLVQMSAGVAKLTLPAGVAGATGPTGPTGAAASVATDTIWDAAGDLAVGSGADTAARLAKGAAGTVPTAGASTIAYALPPGYEFDYAQFTSDVSVASSTEATPTQIVSGGAVTYDGSTTVLIEVYAPNFISSGTAGAYLVTHLWDGATELGPISVKQTKGTGAELEGALSGSHRVTPSAGAHTFKWQVHSSEAGASIQAGAGGTGTRLPGFIRITKV
jgi:hypothetical protein